MFFPPEIPLSGYPQKTNLMLSADLPASDILYRFSEYSAGLCLSLPYLQHCWIYFQINSGFLCNLYQESNDNFPDYG